MSVRSTAYWLMAIACIATALAERSEAQVFGVELHNTMMPASGGMGGASLARPQDLQSAINGNPATLTQFHGTQFSFGGGWVEPTYNLNQTGNLILPNVMPFSGKSGTPGSAIGNIGVTQDFSALDMPATLGIGFITNAGIGTDFRGIPASNGTSSYYLALDIVMGVGVDVTERLSAGVSLALGTSFLDSPFSGVSAMVPDYALRGTVGASYLLRDCTTLGLYWQTKKSFTFRNDIRFGGPNAPFFDVDLDHPMNIGIGLADNSLMCGDLLLAADVLFKQYSKTALLGAIYDDVWVFQVGAQYALNPKMKLRVGYAYHTEMMVDNVGPGGGGVFPGIPALQYVQAQFAAVAPHRITIGAGMRDVLPGIDFDVHAGGMLKGSGTFGTTTASVESYWIGAGITWRFGRGACENGEWCGP